MKADSTVNGNRPYCFVIMSFGDNPVLKDHYELAIKPTVENLGFDCFRADEIEHNEKITDMIVGRLRGSHFVIADLTDERPNCYYELGYAHALRKTVIHIINKMNTPHFDVKDYNFIVYSRQQELVEKLTGRIQSTVQSVTADPMNTLVDAIKKFVDFEDKHMSRLLADRVNIYDVQLSNDKEMLPAPFNLSLSFHVKDGLVSLGERVVLHQSDGALYVHQAKHQGWGRYAEEPRFGGLIQRAADIESLIRKIQDSYSKR